ncbi:capsular biosynthesis protein [Paraburkholderia phytofirmans]|uniref:capsular polysaccharide export protein, LipB/KpsS family n=1 Tax=Paraburkholderia phytofirmans TaxID=261302 RepID=UPI0038B97D0F
MMIVVVIDSMERCYFFLRLVENLRSDHQFYFLTTEPLAHALAVLSNIPSVFVRRKALRLENSPLRAEDGYWKNAIEVLNGHISPLQARRDAAAIEAAMAKIIRSINVARCLIWNGQQLLGRAVTEACNRHGVETIFLEISNLPSKLFVDREGVNALSSIASLPHRLDALPLPSMDAHEAWFRRYEQSKKAPLPQSRFRLSRKLISAINLLIKIVGRGAVLNTSNVLKLSNAVPKIHGSKCYSGDELAKRIYVFLPLQVSADTQLKLHSDVTNIEAIRQAVGYAEKIGAELFVKVHPAETDRGELRQICDLSSKLNFDIVSSATLDLVRNAHSVVTINSTVGLEALMYNKKVITLGRSFYRDFDGDRLKKYIHHFLVDGIDYFGSGAVSADAAKALLNR